MAGMNNSANDSEDPNELETYFEAARTERMQLSEGLKLAILDDAISVQRGFESRPAPADAGDRVFWWNDLLRSFAGWRTATALALSALVGLGSGLAVADTVASLASAVPESATTDQMPDIYSGLEAVLLEG